MIVDGRAIAADIYRELKNQVSHLEVAPHLTVFTCAPNFETQKFLALKKQKAKEVGIDMNVIEFPDSASTEEIKLSIQNSFMLTDGLVVQLPFPTDIDIDDVLKVIPVSLDVDVMNFDGSKENILPPVVGAIKEISIKNDLLLATQKVVVVGSGRLVGQPAAVWFQKQGAQVSIVTAETDVLLRDRLMAEADILVLGTGQPKLVTADMIKDGVIIFDGGTSEDGGVLSGDADPSCIKKASLMTPVPGGIGPITVAILLRNLVILSQQ